MKALQRQRWLAMALITLWVSGFLVPGTVRVAAAGGGGLVPLNTVPVPLPPNLGVFIANQPAAIKLGKALFWDMQTGSDGVQACASCHFQAGADVRTTNTLNPGPNGAFNSVAGAGATLTPNLFPIKTGDIVGSQGVIDTNFVGLSGTAVDNLDVVPDPVFNVDGVDVRRCTGRNAPFAVNAVFYFRNFWDGRANNNFNGVNPSGPAAADSPTVFQVVNGVPTPVTVSIPNASLASQACGPPLSPVEMSGAGRTFPLLGRKLLGLTPLAQQQVDSTDSVLGSLAAAPTGLTTSYVDLIKAAFSPQWWQNPAGDAAIVANGFTMMESNFSLYWGLAILLYESTLVSDQTPLDQFLAGINTALTANQQAGLQVYSGKGRCDQCHSGGELSKATVSQTGGNPTTGFFNTGVRPLAEDGGDILQPGQAKFKTPSLRNIALTGPYFHNGGYATLRQVVDFYNRGGDFPNQFTDGQVRPLNLTGAEKDALVDLMANGMTDQRVLFEQAPFDHPSLNVANGPRLQAVGAAGRITPVKPFLEVNPFSTLKSIGAILPLLLTD